MNFDVFLHFFFSFQGGPGGSGVGFGNFGELGPLDTDLKPRNTTWVSVLKKNYFKLQFLLPLYLFL